jgi:hypothetical protein
MPDDTHAENWDMARTALVNTGAIVECDVHPGSYYHGPGDLEASSKWLKGILRQSDRKTDNRLNNEQRRQLLQAVYEDNSWHSSCAQCPRSDE